MLGLTIQKDRWIGIRKVAEEFMGKNIAHHPSFYGFYVSEEGNGES